MVAARASGATHVVFVQHANTQPSSESQPTAEPHGASSAISGLAPSASLSDLAAASSERSESFASKEPRGLAGSKTMPVIHVNGARGGPTDLNMTIRGHAQCANARHDWFHRLPVRNMFLTSPSTEVINTAHALAGQADPLLAEPPKPPVLVPCKTLLPADGKSVCGTLFAQKGKPLGVRQTKLRIMLDAEGGETAFGQYAEAACRELTDVYRQAMEAGQVEKNRTYISAFGHPVFIHTIAYAVAAAGGMKPQELDAILDLEVDDAEAILVPLYGLGKGAAHFKRAI